MIFLRKNQFSVDSSYLLSFHIYGIKQTIDSVKSGNSLLYRDATHMTNNGESFMKACACMLFDCISMWLSLLRNCCLLTLQFIHGHPPGTGIGTDIPITHPLNHRHGAAGTSRKLDKVLLSLYCLVKHQPCMELQAFTQRYPAL